MKLKPLTKYSVFVFELRGVPNTVCRYPVYEEGGELLDVSGKEPKIPAGHRMLGIEYFSTDEGGNELKGSHHFNNPRLPVLRQEVMDKAQEEVDKCKRKVNSWKR